MYRFQDSKPQSVPLISGSAVIHSHWQRPIP